MTSLTTDLRKEGMLTDFPSFSPIGSVCFVDFSQAVADHLPYSTFNFLTVRCFWPGAELARFGDGLALILTDPVSRLPFMTFLSRTLHEWTLCDMAEFISHRQLEPALRLMPECSLRCLGANAHWIERRDGFDYLICVDSMLDPTALPEQHARAGDFAARFPGIVIREIMPCEFVDEMRTVVNSRKVSCGANRDAVMEWEHLALLRCFELFPLIDLVTVAAFDANGRMLGFTINEITNQSTYIGHFGRTLPGTNGLSALLELETARFMKSRGCLILNFQEDHGDARLRRMKLSWKPIRMLHAYDVQWQS